MALSKELNEKLSKMSSLEREAYLKAHYPKEWEQVQKIQESHKRVSESLKEKEGQFEPKELENPDRFEQKEATPLFKGQDTHPFTQEEMNVFLSRLDYPSWFTDKDDKIEAAFWEMAKTPTGRAQMREILNAEPKDRIFEIDVRSMGSQTFGCYNSYKDRVDVSKEQFDKMSTQQLGNVLLHELNHACHYDIDSSFVFTEVETHSLDAQLAVEMDSKNLEEYNEGYKQIYQQNLEKWRTLAKDPSQLPEWAQDMKYEYLPSPEEKRSGKIDPEREAGAREMYARKMAALETRTQFMEDFYTHDMPYKNKENLPEGYLEHVKKMAMDYESVDRDTNRSTWVGKKTKRGQYYSDKISDEKAIDNLGKRYPGLNKKRMSDRITANKARKEIRRELYTIRYDETLSSTEKSAKKFNVYKKHAQALPPEELEAELNNILLEYKFRSLGNVDETFKKMVAEYEQLTGKKSGLYSNDTQQKNEQTNAQSSLKNRFTQIGTQVNLQEQVQDDRLLQGANARSDMG